MTRSAHFPPLNRAMTTRLRVVPFLLSICACSAEGSDSAAVCRYDLSSGPLKFSVPVSQAYTSVSFYTRNEVAYYAINDRSAGRRIIELDLMTPEQRAELPEDEEIAAADHLIIDLADTDRPHRHQALAAEPDLMPQARASLMAATCRPQGDQASR